MAFGLFGIGSGDSSSGALSWPKASAFPTATRWCRDYWLIGARCFVFW
jgi:hypothetical protein